MKQEAFYYRWLFQESDGHVIVEPDHGRSHSHLAEETNDKGAVHGFAFPIHGGWRVLDYEAKPVGDPFVRNRVINAIHNKGQ